MIYFKIMHMKHHLFSENSSKKPVFLRKKGFFYETEIFRNFFYETGLFHKKSEAVSQNTIWFHQVSLPKMTLFKLCLIIVIVKAKSLFFCVKIVS